MTYRRVARVFASLLLFLASQVSMAAPNVVVILADDLGYGDVSLLNPDSKIHTPNIDAIANAGVYLTDAHAPSAVCSPTRYAMLTGRYAWRNPVLRRGVLLPWDGPVLEPERQTLPQLMKSAGYATAAIGKWHLGFDWPWRDGVDPARAKSGSVSVATNRMFDWDRPIGGGPLAAGFDYYFGNDAPNYPPYAFIENGQLLGDIEELAPDELDSVGVRGFIHGVGPGLRGWRFDQVMPTITRKASEYVTAMCARETPFFLWFSLTAPHTPVAPLAAFHEKSAAGHYGDFVVQTDQAVGDIVEALKASQCFDDTLLFVTSDNGPSRLVQGVMQSHEHFPAAHLRGMKGELWEGGHRVPLVASWPAGEISGGKAIADLTSLSDLYATLAAVVGIAVSQPVDSVDLLASLRGGGGVRDEMVYHGASGRFGLRSGDWVYLDGKGGSNEPGWYREALGIVSPDAGRQLFNLADDPGQRVNIVDRHPALAERLAARLDAITAGSDASIRAR